MQLQGGQHCFKEFEEEGVAMGDKKRWKISQ